MACVCARGTGAAHRRMKAGADFPRVVDSSTACWVYTLFGSGCTDHERTLISLFAEQFVEFVLVGVITEVAIQFAARLHTLHDLALGTVAADGTIDFERGI